LRQNRDGERNGSVPPSKTERAAASGGLWSRKRNSDGHDIAGPYGRGRAAGCASFCSRRVISASRHLGQRQPADCAGRGTTWGSCAHQQPCSLAQVMELPQREQLVSMQEEWSLIQFKPQRSPSYMHPPKTTIGRKCLLSNRPELCNRGPCMYGGERQSLAMRSLEDGNQLRDAQSDTNISQREERRSGATHVRGERRALAHPVLRASGN